MAKYKALGPCSPTKTPNKTKTKLKSFYRSTGALVASQRSTATKQTPNQNQNKTHIKTGRKLHSSYQFGPSLSQSGIVMRNWPNSLESKEQSGLFFLNSILVIGFQRAWCLFHMTWSSHGNSGSAGSQARHQRRQRWMS